ncbi:MAG: hypothetical protein J7480_04780 [Microbacteriaceae bacterium]|nr:hypothetical protein [Microbacteriaceae bacterium]
MDEFEERLRAAAPTVADDAGVRGALAAVVAGRTHRQGRAPFIGLAVTGVLALGGIGAAAAAGAFEWSVVTEPDYSIGRDWYDVAGNRLGSCEERVDVTMLDAQVRPAVEAWFATHDVSTMQPRAEWVAHALLMRGDPERLPELLPGETIEPYLADYQGPADGMPSHVSQAHTKYADARILQEALSREVNWQIARAIRAASPEIGDAAVTGTFEIHCTTDWDQR